MEVALYKNLNYNYELVADLKDKYDDKDDYVRISDIVEIRFDLLNDAEITKKHVSMIDKQIKTVQAAAESKLNELKQKRDELLALPDMSGE